MPPPSRQSRRRPRTTTAVSKASAASASRRTRRSSTAVRSYMFTESRAMTARKMKTVQRDILEREARAITSKSPSKIVRSSDSGFATLSSIGGNGNVERPEDLSTSLETPTAFQSTSTLSPHSSNFKSNSLEIEIRLREREISYTINCIINSITIIKC